MTFKAQIKASLGWDWNEGLRDNGRLEYAKDLADGAGDNQADAVWSARQQTLAVGQAITYDLAAMTRTILGATHVVALTAVKAMLVVNETLDGGELILGGADDDPWSEPFGTEDDRVIIPPQSALLLSSRRSGWPVDSAARNLRIAASLGDATYSIAMIGTLAMADSSSGSGE